MITMLLRQPRNSKLTESDFVKSRMQADMPIASKSMSFRVLRTKRQGAFKEIEIEYVHDSATIDGPKEVQ